MQANGTLPDDDFSAALLRVIQDPTLSEGARQMALNILKWRLTHLEDSGEEPGRDQVQAA
ncbi:MAG TPA: hypothetical protein VE650_20520 [Acetobacteraceae bacterium]|nr:hypothetical protein [Acetobacteraceae bacterium]